ncbi:hypothetical protein V2J09_001714, partial [Rumex salicifolius]
EFQGIEGETGANLSPSAPPNIFPAHPSSRRLCFIGQLLSILPLSRIIPSLNLPLRYMIMEIFLDPNKDLTVDDPIIITQFNVANAIKDSILVNFGECGLASSLGSLQVKYINPITKVCVIRTSRKEHQMIWSAVTMIRSIGNCPVLFNLLDLSGSIRACKDAALRCEEAKFEQYKLLVGDCLTEAIKLQMHNCLEKIRETGVRTADELISIVNSNYQLV